MSQQKISVHGEDRVFLQSGHDTILRAALRSGIGFPYECNCWWMRELKFELVTGDVESIWPEAPGLTERDRRKGRLLACQCRAKSALGIKIRTDPIYEPIQPPKRRSARFVESHDVTHDIREFRFVTEDKAAFPCGPICDAFNPGRHCASSLFNVEHRQCTGRVAFPDSTRTSRASHRTPFSSCSCGRWGGDRWCIWRRVPSNRGQARYCLRSGWFGSGTDGFNSSRSLAIGHARYPSSSFFLRWKEHRQTSVELRFCVNYRDTTKQIHFYPVVSLPNEIPGSQWSGETGYVHDAVQRVFEESLREFEFYFAGPPPMTQTLQEMLMVGYKVPFDQIHFDRFF
uniref:Putative oxidoreductase n=1 Tax=Burkholderia cepacia TaxID=292 RepID=O07073_BURCE|nr:putative oxidoreductase [Burkholderia cepacia]